MDRHPQLNATSRLLDRVDSRRAVELPAPQQGFPLKHVFTAPPNTATIAETRIASLKVLALSLLGQIESLEGQIGADELPELNLQREVHEFEATMIRSALAKTGGRQRRAARLLGVKVTTLNTKIKRLGINPGLPHESATEADNQTNVKSEAVS